MADIVGNQGGFEGITGAADKFKESSGIFKTAVGEWAFGVLSMKKVMEQNADNLKGAGETAIKMTGILGGLTDAFTKSKIVDVVADLSSSLYDTRKELERTYGLFGKGRKDVTDSLRKQTDATNKLGIRLRDNKESFVALANAFGTTSFDTELSSVASQINKAFGVGVDQAAQIAFSLKTFGGKDAQGAMKFMDNIDISAREAGLSFFAVGEAVAQSAKSMYRFQLNTDKGAAKFNKMAISSVKMGVGIDHMVDAMDQYRTIPGAIEGSVTASLAGLNLSANQLLAGARGSDPSVMFNKVFEHIKKVGTNDGKTLNSMGIDIANQLGPMINMSRNEIQNAMARMDKTGQSSLDHYKTMNERLRLQTGVMDRVESVLYDISFAVWPIVEPIFGILEWVTKSAGWTQALLIASVAFYKRALIGRGLDKVLGPIPNNTDMFGNVIQDGDGNTGYGKGQNRPRRPDGTFGSGMSPKQMGGKSQMMTAQAKQMGGAAVMMLAFAGSMMMLAKSFQMFGDVEWKDVGKGGAAMSGLVGSIILMGRFVQASGPALLGLSAALVGVGAAMVGIGFAAQLFQGVDLVNIGLGFGALSVGLLAMAGVGALMIGSGGIMALFAGAGMVGIITAMTGIGMVAAKYATPIETMANSLSVLAGAMERLNAIDSIKEINFDIDSGTLESLEKVSLALAGSSNASSERIIENHITIKLEDGTKLYRGMHKSVAKETNGGRT